MKTVIGILVLLGVVTTASAQTSVSPSSMKVDLNGPRPSCEMLAWRWVNSLGRLTEVEGARPGILKSYEDLKVYQVIANRVSKDNAEGSDAPVIQTLSFNVKGVTEGNFHLTSISTPAIKWENVTENITDKVDIKVTEGKVTVVSQISYADICFYKKASQIRVEVNGRPLILSWSGRSLDINKYLDLLE